MLGIIQNSVTLHRINFVWVSYSYFVILMVNKEGWGLF